MDVGHASTSPPRVDTSSGRVEHPWVYGSSGVGAVGTEAPVASASTPAAGSNPVWIPSGVAATSAGHATVGPQRYLPAHAPPAHAIPGYHTAPPAPSAPYWAPERPMAGPSQAQPWIPAPGGHFEWRPYSTPDAATPNNNNHNPGYPVTQPTPAHAGPWPHGPWYQEAPPPAPGYYQTGPQPASHHGHGYPSQSAPAAVVGHPSGVVWWGSGPGSASSPSTPQLPPHPSSTAEGSRPGAAWQPWPSSHPSGPYPGPHAHHTVTPGPCPPGCRCPLQQGGWPHHLSLAAQQYGSGGPGPSAAPYPHPAPPSHESHPTHPSWSWGVPAPTGVPAAGAGAGAGTGGSGNNGMTHPVPSGSPGVGAQAQALAGSLPTTKVGKAQRSEARPNRVWEPAKRMRHGDENTAPAGPTARGASGSPRRPSSQSGGAAAGAGGAVLDMPAPAGADAAPAPAPAPASDPQCPGGGSTGDSSAAGLTRPSPRSGRAAIPDDEDNDDGDSGAGDSGDTDELCDPSGTGSGNLFGCKFCSYTSHKAAQVRVHTRTHTGEKPYKCAFCDFRSAQGGNVRIHERRHTGDKRYPCPYCPFASVTSSATTTHIRRAHTKPEAAAGAPRTVAGGHRRVPPVAALRGDQGLEEWVERP